MAQPKPLTPFFSTDPRVTPAPTQEPQEPAQCECDDRVEFSLDEIVKNECERCGKAVRP